MALTAGLTQKAVQKAVAAALERAPELAEWQDAAYLARNRWTGWRSALLQAHAPAEEADLAPNHPARARLAFDELLASQLAIALVRHHNRTIAGPSPKAMVDCGRSWLLFLDVDGEPTGARSRRSSPTWPKPERMVRLLQGDVGSGKTLVAFLAMLIGVEAGAQAALMAPTELSGPAAPRYHRAARRSGRRVRPCSPAATARSRSGKPCILADGSIPLVVGTHALLQEDVEFATWRSRWSTSSIASACISAWRCRRRATPSNFW